MRARLWLLVLVPTTAVGQATDDDLPDGPVRIPAVQVESFEGASVTATVQRPDGVVVVEPSPTAHPPLLRLRDDFDRELRQARRLVR